ncbi:MAG: hypothetical protein ABI724_13350 [Betaproteobacteria bacterium]
MNLAIRLFVGFAAIGLAGGAALAQTAAKGDPDPVAILAAAKEASGGAAWNGFATQHSLVALMAGGFSGEAERWSEIATGRSVLRFTLGPIAGTMGYDGTVAWSQDPSGKTSVGTDEAGAELAANAAYRDQLAFWFPARHAASITYKRRAPADDALFDVVAITPNGGREFELWINTQTHLIERLAEREAQATRTEIYMDWKDVRGVKIPFRVRVLRGDPKADELVVIERIEFDGSLAGVSFAKPN